MELIKCGSLTTLSSSNSLNRLCLNLYHHAALRFTLCHRLSRFGHVSRCPTCIVSICNKRRSKRAQVPQVLLNPHPRHTHIHTLIHCKPLKAYSLGWNTKGWARSYMQEKLSRVFFSLPPPPLKIWLTSTSSHGLRAWGMLGRLATKVRVFQNSTETSEQATTCTVATIGMCVMVTRIAWVAWLR